MAKQCKPRAKLTIEQVREIIAILRPSSPPGIIRHKLHPKVRKYLREQEKELARVYGVHPVTIGQLRAKKSWIEVWNEC